MRAHGLVVMTTPLHGVGHRFKSGWAHLPIAHTGTMETSSLSGSSIEVTESSQPTTSTGADHSSRRRRRDTARVIAGALTVAAGVLALINGVTVLANETSFLWLEIDIALNQFSVCATLVIIFGAVAVAGGIAAIRGKHFFLALAGAALGTIGDGVAGFFLGLIAIVLLFLSNEDV